MNRDDPVTLEEPHDPVGPREPPVAQRMGQRLFHVVVIWLMLSVAWTVLSFVTILQAVIQLTSRGVPNERLAEFGEGLGIWVAKAVRYQAAASEVRPWPWTDID